MSACCQHNIKYSPDYHPSSALGFALMRRPREGEIRERDVINAVPPHLRRDVFRSRRYGLHAWRFLFQFGRALMRIIREHSLGSRCSGNPTDVRPRDASLVVSQALWICSLQVGRPRSTADLAARMNISRHQFDSNSIPPDHRNGTL